MLPLLHFQILVRKFFPFATVVSLAIFSLNWHFWLSHCLFSDGKWGPKYIDNSPDMFPYWYWCWSIYFFLVKILTILVLLWTLFDTYQVSQKNKIEYACLWMLDDIFERFWKISKSPQNFPATNFSHWKSGLKYKRKWP